MARHLALDRLVMAVRPGEGEGADETGPSVRVRSQAVVDDLHGDVEILFGSGPSGREYAGIAVEGINGKTRIVGQGWEPGRRRRRMRLEPGVGGKTRTGLFGFGQVQFRRRHDLGALRFEESCDLAHLARVVAGDNQAAAVESPGHQWTGRRRVRYAVTTPFTLRRCSAQGRPAAGRPRSRPRPVPTPGGPRTGLR